MSNSDETYEKEKKLYQRLTYIVITTILVSVALAILGYFLHSTDLFVFFLVFTILSFLVLIILGAERIETFYKHKIIH